MKKLLFIFFIFISASSFAQSYTNSWIDYNKTYYKFTVGKTGLFRIPQSALNSIGLGNIPAEQFQLWRNGEEVGLYTSVTTGLLSSSFLTINTSGSNLRFVNSANNVAGNTLSPEPYFVNTKSVYYKNKINPGFGYNLTEYVYSSSYDIGEGWTSNDVAPGFALFYLIDSLYMYSGGPLASFNFAVAGNAPNIRNIRVKFYNNVIDDEPMSNFTYLKKQVNNIPASYFPSPDHVFSLTYPSKFNFNNKKSFYFELPATNTGNYLVIDNFNFGNTNPVLLDITTGARYTGDITSIAGKVQFVLPPSGIAKRKFELISEDASNINIINSLTERNFVNYGVAANQGNYLIISNPVLYNNGSGVNNVDLYKVYRISSGGGGYDAKVYDIDQLTDQFAYGIKKHPLAIKDFIQYATSTFSAKPQYVFLIGKGITYNDYITNQNSVYDDQLDLIPTFGNPASDILLSSPYGSTVPNIPIGRLSAISGNEVGIYLQKVKEYENAQVSGTQTLDSKLIYLLFI
jgi:hypothetical protein